MSNLLLSTDSYKFSHRRQYPEGTTQIYSYMTARGSRIPGVDKVVFYGLRYYVEKYLAKGISAENVMEAIDIVSRHLGPDAIDPDMRKMLFRLAQWRKLPIHIKALPEMSEVDMNVPLFTITNTSPRYYWLTNFLETLLCKVWYPSTLATSSLRMKRLLDYFAAQTCDDDSHVQWQSHDFSYRGVSSQESAEIAGLVHLLYSSGTDTVGALKPYEETYGSFKGWSVSASEHSTATMYGSGEGEYDYLNRMLDIYPKGIVSVVADSFDYYNFITRVVSDLRYRIKERDGKVVIRPDSSPKTPLEVICGDPEAPYGSPEQKGSLQILWEIFGGTVNSKGYKVLDPHIGLIYGDAISFDMADKIFRMMAWQKWASSNIVFGTGAFGRQMVSRDTFNFAIKATYGVVNGVGREIYKDPATDKKKRSAKGLLYVGQHDDGTFYYEDQVSPEREQEGLLQTVYRDGVISY